MKNRIHKKWKAVFAMFLCGVMCFGLFAFSACDPSETQLGDETENGQDSSAASSGGDAALNGGTEITAETLRTAAAESLTAMLSSADGYEFSADLFVRTGEQAENGDLDTESVSVSAEGKAKAGADGVWNADAAVDVASSYTYSSGGSVYSGAGYGYAELYLRGEDVYAGFLDSDSAVTDSQKADILLYRENIGQEYGGETQISEELSLAATAQLENFAPMLLSVNFGGATTETEEGYTLTFDVDEMLLAASAQCRAVLNMIVSYDGTLSLTAFLQNGAVKSYLQEALDGYTGEDIYGLAVAIEAFMQNYGEGSVIGYLTEGTAEQTAYDYIAANVSALETEYGAVVLNDGDALAFCKEILSALEMAEAVLADASIEFVFGFDTDCVLTDMRFSLSDLSYVADGVIYSVEISAGVSWEEKDVTLAADIVYVIGEMYGYSEDDGYASVFLMSDGSAKIYTFDENDCVAYAADGSYTLKDGDWYSLTVSGETYLFASEDEYGDNYFELVLAGTTYVFYDWAVWTY